MMTIVQLETRACHFGHHSAQGQYLMQRPAFQRPNLGDLQRSPFKSQSVAQGYTSICEMLQSHTTPLRNIHLQRSRVYAYLLPSCFHPKWCGVLCTYRTKLEASYALPEAFAEGGAKTFLPTQVEHCNDLSEPVGRAAAEQRHGIIEVCIELVIQISSAPAGNHWHDACDYPNPS